MGFHGYTISLSSPKLPRRHEHTVEVLALSDPPWVGTPLRLFVVRTILVIRATMILILGPLEQGDQSLWLEELL